MFNKEQEKAEQFENARNTVWQMDKEMEVLLGGLREDRESILAEIALMNQRGIDSRWKVHEMTGIDRAIALLTPDIGEQ